MQSIDSCYDVAREGVQRYFYWRVILLIAVAGVGLVGLGLVIAVLYALTLGLWLSRKQALVLRYWLDGSTLRIEQGVFFLNRKAIPLDRVTDLVLSQGPLMRWCGIWGLRVQTAGSGQQMPEATLYGLLDPESVRDVLLKTRDDVAGSVPAASY